MTMNLQSVKKMDIKLNKKNPIVKDLYTKKYKPKIVKPKKGKGSFKRKKSQVKSLAPICWITFDDISVPFSRQSFVDNLLTCP